MGLLGKLLRTDNKKLPLPQYFDPGSDNFEVLQGRGGSLFTTQTGSLIEDVLLQQNATQPGDGALYTPTKGNVNLSFEITGTSESRKVIFEIAGPSGVFATCVAFSVVDPAKMATQTIKGSDEAPESWQVDVPVGWTFRARVDQVDSGSVKIIGKGVIS